MPKLDLIYGDRNVNFGTWLIEKQALEHASMGGGLNSNS